MPALVQNGIPIFTDIDGDPLEEGYIYIGEAGLNPLSNPLQAYWDADLTVPAGNLPTARTKGGAASYNGAPSRLYVATNYSILVQDKKQRTVYSVLNSVDYYNSPSGDLISQTDTLATLREIVPVDNNFTVQVKGHTTIGDVSDIPLYYWDVSSTATDNNGSVVKPTAIDAGSPGRFVWKGLSSVDIRWFGADPLGISDSSQAFQDAISYINSLSGLADTGIDYKGRRTLNLSGGSYKINSGFLTVDSSKIRISGGGASLDFKDHDGDTNQFLLLTSTGDFEDTLSSNLSTLEDFTITGRGKTISTFNTGLLIDASAGQTSAGIAIRNVGFGVCYIGSDHQESSYNITYDTCKFYRCTTDLKLTESTDMFERCVLISCSFANSEMGIESNANDGTIYCYGCSFDNNTVHMDISAGGIELHGCHIEGDLIDDPMIVVSGDAVFNAFGGWWLFKPGSLGAATQEFDASGCNQAGLITVKDVKFSTSGSGLPFTLNPENIEVINPKPDSTSLLTLLRFNNQYATRDRFFDEGSIVADIWIEDEGTVFTDRFTTNVTALTVETGDAEHAYSGNNYLKLDKNSGAGANCWVYMAIPLGEKRRFAGRARMKSLSGSTANVNITGFYGTLSPNVTSDDYVPYKSIGLRQIAFESKAISSDYQAYDFNMKEKALSSDTHAIIRLGFFNLPNSEVAIDDMYISLV